VTTDVILAFPPADAADAEAGRTGEMGGLEEVVLFPNKRRISSSSSSDKAAAVARLSLKSSSDNSTGDDKVKDERAANIRSNSSISSRRNDLGLPLGALDLLNNCG
jgi:hypothetical protein